MGYTPSNLIPTSKPTGDYIYLGNPSGISAYADQQTDAANNYLLKLGEAVAGLTPPVITPLFPAGAAAPPVTTISAPTLTPIVWTAPDAPPAFIGSLTVDDILPAPFENDPPALVFGSAPTFTNVAPDAPAIDTSYVMPTLDVTLPAAPALLSLSVSPFSGINLPTIDTTIPTLNVDAPSIREYVPGANYTSSLLTATSTKLQSIIQNGGTGLSPDAENAIWDRDREREARSRADTLAELDKMEQMGFMLPPGAYTDARLKIATESDYANRGASREIMIKQAELTYQALKDALPVAVQLEGQLITYSNAVEQRLFDACKYATEAGIAIYNARVQAYAAYLDAFKARIAVYEAQVRAELTKVEVYKAQIDAELAKAQINRALVDSYKVQVDAALSNVEVFKARIGAIQAKADIEKTKIEIFGEQVRAYGVQVQAYTAGVEGFRATIQAEATKQDVFKSQVDAYRAQVEAAGQVVNARIATFKGNLEAYTARWDGYKSAYQAEAARVGALAQSNSSEADIFRSEASVLTSFNETLTKQWQVGLDQAQRVSEIGISAAKANAELYMTTRSLAVDAAKVGATVSAQLGAAALNAINWSSSVNNSYGESWSNSNSVGVSFSDSTSDSTTHSYNYSGSIG